MCLEQSSAEMDVQHCRQAQSFFDACMKDKLGMERPHYGYHSLIHVHDSNRSGIEFDSKIKSDVKNTLSCFPDQNRLTRNRNGWTILVARARGRM